MVVDLFVCEIQRWCSYYNTFIHFQPTLVFCVLVVLYDLMYMYDKRGLPTLPES